jgi:DNA processing protein
MDKNKIKYWLAINKIPNVGPVTIKKLWDKFGTLEEAWKASPRSICEVEDISKPAAKSFLENRDRANFEAELAEVEKKNVKVLTLEDDDYPKNLKNIYDPPPVLYVKGGILPSDIKAIGIVGTRRASRYGLEMARKLAEELALLGITIISGLAAGIDTSAHQGAIDAQGRTIAAMGSGIDIVYPYQNKDLAAQIERSGALVSEFPIGTKSEKGNFPRRNRIISGLSLGVIVVEGHYDSGAMITAKQALEQGREVFAVPGNVELEQSKGPHWLIKQGAKLVENVQDVLEELNIQLQTSNLKTNPKSQTDQPTNKRTYKPANLLPEEEKIFNALNQEPKHLDVIAAETGLPVQQVSSLLMMLEIRKVVRQLPGKYYITG